MRGLQRAALLLALVSCALLPGGQKVVAQGDEQLAPAVAAVIDYQRILRESMAAESIRKQVESRRQRYQDEIAQEEQRLNEEDKELAAQRAVLSPEAFAEERRDFEGEVAAVQRMVQSRRQLLDEVSAVALAEVRNAIIDVIGGLAQRYGFNIVLPSSGVLLFSPRIDLTEEVLEQLNRKLPDVEVPENIGARE